jgi:hypothetical protein
LDWDVAAGRRKFMNDKISVPLSEYVEITAARPCIENFSTPGMNFVFAIRSQLTAKTISLQKFWRIGITGR